MKLIKYPEELQQSVLFFSSASPKAVMVSLLLRCYFAVLQYFGDICCFLEYSIAARNLVLIFSLRCVSHTVGLLTITQLIVTVFLFRFEILFFFLSHSASQSLKPLLFISIVLLLLIIIK